MLKVYADGLAKVLDEPSLEVVEDLGPTPPDAPNTLGEVFTMYLNAKYV